MSPFPYRHQPFKALYLMYEVITTVFIRLPFWFIVSIPTTLRPRASWDLRRCLWLAFIRRMALVEARVGQLATVPDHRALVEGPDVKGVWINPVPGSHVVGNLRRWSRSAHVEPIRIPGYWFDTVGSTMAPGAPPLPGEKMIYGIHGGSFTKFSANPRDVSAPFMTTLLARSASAGICRAFRVEYRLSVDTPYPPANPFPAALLDVLAGYEYLVNVVGLNPEDIVIEGDSAGGNLALALVRYLIDNRDALSSIISHKPLAPPGGIILISPWVDVGTSHNFPSSSMFTNEGSDFLDLAKNRYPVIAYLGPHDASFAQTCVYISPASRDVGGKDISYKGFPRTLIIVGGAEMLVDQIRTLKDRMISDMGTGSGAGQLCYHEAPDGCHVFVVLDFHEPERTEAWMKVAEWLEAS